LNNQQDSSLITQALETIYYKGIYEGNVDLLKNIYYPGTHLFGDIKGQPYATTLRRLCAASDRGGFSRPEMSAPTFILSGSHRNSFPLQGLCPNIVS
jgi:hypothetical protein